MRLLPCVLVSNIGTHTLTHSQAAQMLIQRCCRQYRKDTAMVHGSVADILVILTESGFLYCALWILVILVEFKTFNPLTLQVWVAILPQIAVRLFHLEICLWLTYSCSACIPCL